MNVRKNVKKSDIIRVSTQDDVFVVTKKLEMRKGLRIEGNNM